MSTGHAAVLDLILGDFCMVELGRSREAEKRQGGPETMLPVSEWCSISILGHYPCRIRWALKCGLFAAEVWVCEAELD